MGTDKTLISEYRKFILKHPSASRKDSYLAGAYFVLDLVAQPGVIVTKSENLIGEDGKED